MEKSRYISMNKFKAGLQTVVEDRSKTVYVRFEAFYVNPGSYMEPEEMTAVEGYYNPYNDCIVFKGYFPYNPYFLGILHRNCLELLEELGSDV